MMAEEEILKETDRTSGREALRKNVQASLALAGAVRSTLGPMGLDKLLVDDEGRTLVTNDGVTILENAKVEINNPTIEDAIINQPQIYKPIHQKYKNKKDKDLDCLVKVLL